jgi:hypothetical protein
MKSTLDFIAEISAGVSAARQYRYLGRETCRANGSPDVALESPYQQERRLLPPRRRERYPRDRS